MASPQKLLDSYRSGMKRDFPRDQMPKDSVWNLVDFVPEILGAPLRKRGGWAYASPVLPAAAQYIIAGIVAPFSSGKINAAFDEDGRGAAITSPSATGDIGAVQTTRDPAFYNDKILVPHDGGTALPKYITWNGTVFTVTTMAAGAPAGRYMVIHKDVAWLASPSALVNRIYFSTTGNPLSWNTTDRWLDVSYPITGMAALSNAVMVFSLERTARVRGSIPPPDSDFIVDDPLFAVGCTDNRSIALYRDKVIWANASGLFISDGTALEDLTAICGMKNWWLDIMSGRDGFSTGTEYSPTGFTIVTEVFRDILIYCVMNGASKVDAGFIDLKRFVWGRFSNFGFSAMWGDSFPEDVYLGLRGTARVASFSEVLQPLSANAEDADAVDLLPYLETPFSVGPEATKTLRAVYLGYDIRDPGANNPFLTVSYIDSPEETSYTALSPTLLETTQKERERLVLNFPARGIAFKVAQTGTSSDTRIYSMEIDGQAREANR